MLYELNFNSISTLLTYLLVLLIPAWHKARPLWSWYSSRIFPLSLQQCGFQSRALRYRCFCNGESWASRFSRLSNRWECRMSCSWCEKVSATTFITSDAMLSTPVFCLFLSCWIAVETSGHGTAITNWFMLMVMMTETTIKCHFHQLVNWPACEMLFTDFYFFLKCFFLLAGIQPNP